MQWPCDPALDPAGRAVETQAGMTLDVLPTPCLLLDRAKLEANLARMRERAHALGVALRPHMKTAKSAEVARRALCGERGGITVSTLREADYFSQHGFDDILYAVAMVPGKIGEAARIIGRGTDLAVILDDAAAAQALAEGARREGIVLPVMIEIDSDGHRSGLRPDDPAISDVARVIAAAGALTLRGVMTHAGGSYDCTTGAEITAIAEQERRAVFDAAERLRRAGFACPVVSVGSTPTAAFAERLDGVTEMRPGVYMFGDLFQAGLGVCALDDIALSVLATVIQHKPARNRLIVDAGALALSKDRSTADQPVDHGYGLVCDASGRPLAAGLVVIAVNQEHGMITPPDGARLDFAAFPIGTRLRILPNHACMTAAAYERYHLVEGAAATGHVWQRCNGWTAAAA